MRRASSISVVPEHLVSSRHTAPGALMVETQAGVIEKPSPELTNLKTVSHSGASCTISGRNPSVSQSAIVLSQAKGPRSRGNSTRGSPFNHANEIRFRFFERMSLGFAYLEDTSLCRTKRPRWLFPNVKLGRRDVTKYVEQYPRISQPLLSWWRSISKRSRSSPGFEGGICQVSRGCR
jgi:hypothetical protein